MYIHGNNLYQKENHKNKYRDSISKEYLKEIRLKYDIWKKANLDLVGPTKEITKQDFKVISERTKLLNEYKNFIDKRRYAEKFDSRSNLHSSVLEEFMFYLFKDLVHSFSHDALLGKSRTFKDIFFKPNSYQDMLNNPNTLIERKDHDFAITACSSGSKASNNSSQQSSNSEQSSPTIPATIIDLTQVGCQFLEVETKDYQYQPKSAADCQEINSETLATRKSGFKSLELQPGKYIFRVTNSNVPYPLGFYLRGEGIKKVSLPKVSGGGLTQGTTKDFDALRP